MRRSEINAAFRAATACFQSHHWALPPQPYWDITDFGLGHFTRFGLTLVNLAAEPEYCEKLMYAQQGQETPCHTHAHKKEDIVCRAGLLTLWLWPTRPANRTATGGTLTLALNGHTTTLPAGTPWQLPAGQRVTLTPGIWHAFAPASAECIIGEVSTANDDVHDNRFLDPAIGRFPDIEEDEPAQVRLIRE